MKPKVEKKTYPAKVLQNYFNVFSEILSAISNPATESRFRGNVQTNLATRQTYKDLKQALSNMHEEANASGDYQVFLRWKEQPWETENGEMPEDVKRGETMNDELMNAEIEYTAHKFKASKLPDRYGSEDLSVFFDQYLAFFEAVRYDE